MSGACTVENLEMTKLLAEHSNIEKNPASTVGYSSQVVKTYLTYE
jgi:hypothetical protein